MGPGGDYFAIRNNEIASEKQEILVETEKVEFYIYIYIYILRLKIDPTVNYYNKRVLYSLNLVIMAKTAGPKIQNEN